MELTAQEARIVLVALDKCAVTGVQVQRLVVDLAERLESFIIEEANGNVPDSSEQSPEGTE